MATKRQTKIEKKHAEIWNRQQAEPVSHRFLSLPGEMDKAQDWLGKLPEDHEYTLDELEWLEDARRAASRLVAEIDLTHEGIDGRPSWKS